MRSTSDLTRRQAIRLGGATLAGSLASLACGGLAPRLHAASGRSGRGVAFDDYVAHDGLGLAALVRKGEVTASELLEAAVSRMEAVDHKLNAVSVRFVGRAVQSVEGGVAPGPFQGVPYLLKDLHLDLEGTLTTNGSRLFRDHVATRDSTLSRRYVEAGLVVFGKSATPELGMSGSTESVLHGPTHNPWKLGRTPGGSSGGAAACVSAGVLPLANASDGGGSIRIPASCCGLFGLKPSRGRTPFGPARSEGWSGLSHIHAVTRSVRDSAALLDATSGPEPGSTVFAPRPERPFLEEVDRAPGTLHIALMRRPLDGQEIHPECSQAVDDAAMLAESLGHVVEEAPPRLPSLPALNDTSAAVSAGLADTVGKRLAQLGRPLRDDDLEPFTRLLYEEGLGVDAQQLMEARRIFYRLGLEMAEFQQRYDVILSPTLGTPPVELGWLTLQDVNEVQAYAAHSVKFSPFTFLFNVTGQPSMSVPLHWSSDGLPIGTMWSGRYGDEATLFRLAAQLEKARPWSDRRPPL
jgi:amidase/6-aminohexanoate-cyclic-dimer hydrolase